MPWSVIATTVLIAGNSIINPDGMFVYSASGPGAGNLVFSIANAGVTADSYGNTVIGGGAAAYGTGSNVGYLASASLQFGVNSGDIANSRAGKIDMSGSGTLRILSGLQSALDTEGEVDILSNLATGGFGNRFQVQCSTSFFNGVGYTALGTAPNDTNSGSTWVSGERSFMNNNWVTYMNNINTALVNMFG